MHGSNIPTIPVQVQVAGAHTDALLTEARERVRAAIRQHAGRPVLHARVRITRDGGPDRPVVAQANIDLDGRLVRAQVHARTDREALELLEERLRNRMQHASRTVGNWEDRRGRGALSMAGPQPGDERTEWRHGDLPTRRGPSYPRPPAERQIIRHKSFTVAEWGIDEAAFDMETLDYDSTCSPSSGPARTASCTAAAPPATGSLKWSRTRRHWLATHWRSP